MTDRTSAETAPQAAAVAAAAPDAPRPVMGAVPGAAPGAVTDPGPANGDTARGFAFALTAYVLWGFLPIYLKALATVPAAEVVAHRIVWSVPVALLVLVALGRTSDLRSALRSPRMLRMAATTAALITVNWGLYVWAIASGHTLDAALGYYINPLFSVLLGRLLLKERLLPLQWAAIALAALAVVILTVEAGRLPVVALGLTVSWGFYALLRKTLPIGANQGFTLEVVILALPALAYILWLEATGAGHFRVTAGQTALLLGCGLVTAGPLMIYANGAKGLRLSTIGIMQYIAPTMIFLVAVFVFGEPVDRGRAIAFPLIWLALILYTAAILRQGAVRRGALRREAAARAEGTRAGPAAD